MHTHVYVFYSFIQAVVLLVYYLPLFHHTVRDTVDPADKITGTNHPASKKDNRIFGGIPRGVVFGVLGASLFILIVIILAMMALYASRRLRKRYTYTFL